MNRIIVNGIEHYTQSYEYYKNKKHKYHSEKYPGLTFDSKWEVNVYEFCKDNKIEVEYSPSISLKYEYDGRTWAYHPDFLINGKIYEVKGDQFFRINESTGKEEMFCPYGRMKLGKKMELVMRKIRIKTPMHVEKQCPHLEG